MDFINTEDNPGDVKAEFKNWVKKYYEDLVSLIENSL